MFLRRELLALLPLQLLLPILLLASRRRRTCVLANKDAVADPSGCVVKDAAGDFTWLGNHGRWLRRLLRQRRALTLQFFREVAIIV